MMWYFISRSAYCWLTNIVVPTRTYWEEKACFNVFNTLTLKGTRLTIKILMEIFIKMIYESSKFRKKTSQLKIVADALLCWFKKSFPSRPTSVALFDFRDWKTFVVIEIITHSWSLRKSSMNHKLILTSFPCLWNKSSDQFIDIFRQINHKGS